MDLHVDWTPGIGDPTFMGWFTVFAYFATAVLAVLARRAIRERVPEAQRGRQVGAWGWVVALLVALGINKQLDLQTLFTMTARALLKETGLYPRHRELQIAFIEGLGVLALLLLAALAWRVRRRRREYWLLLVGLTFTLTFVVARAASLHHVDLFLGSYVMGMKVNVLLELTGIALVAAAAWIRRRQALGPAQS